VSKPFLFSNSSTKDWHTADRLAWLEAHAEAQAKELAAIDFAFGNPLALDGLTRAEKAAKCMSKIGQQAKRLAEAERLLRICSADYNHPHFTDRGGMGPRLRAFLAEAQSHTDQGDCA
jgi:hypothetical protein